MPLGLQDTRLHRFIVQVQIPKLIGAHTEPNLLGRLFFRVHVMTHRRHQPHRFYSHRYCHSMSVGYELHMSQTAPVTAELTVPTCQWGSPPSDNAKRAVRKARGALDGTSQPAIATRLNSRFFL
jgi:hypothetical protein